MSFPPYGYWEEHPNYPVSDWQYEVANGDTRQGYHDWCELQEEMEADAESTEAVQEVPMEGGHEPPRNPR